MAKTPETVRIIRVFVSSPSDVQEERGVLDEVIASINRIEGQPYGVRLELFKWEDDVAPQIGPNPQQVVDDQTPGCHVYLGIMSTRFGTPTDGYGSGTEKEFADALKQWQVVGTPWIAFYFDDSPTVSRKPQELAQYLRVCEFRERLEKQGIICGYTGARGSKGSFYEKVAEHLRKIVRKLVTPQEAAPGHSPPSSDCIEYYVKRLTEETRNLTMLGMGRSLQVELPIEDAYVPLQTTMARSFETQERGRFEEDRADYEEVVDLGEVFRKAQLLGQRGVVLLGEPGSGKTTGARQVIWRLASGKNTPESLGLSAGMLPVFLRFRNLTSETLSKKQGLRDFLEHETRCAEAPVGCDAPGEDLWNRGRLLWVLDGLDEVINPDARKKVSRWIVAALKHRPDDWFIVTCRFQGYYRQGVPLGSQFIEFHVRPLDDRQVERFIRDWFVAAYRKLQGPGERAETRAKADIDQLLEILARPDYQMGHMRELCRNPLLLTILCIVFHEERKLPTGRAELYAHCVRVLLEYWRRDLYETEGGAIPYDAEAAESVLAGVAWWMHQEQNRTTAPLDELAAVAEQGLAQVSPSSGLGRDGRVFLERMRDEAGILAMAGEGECGFLHLSFQEYLAADHAAREGRAKELASRAGDSWWREAALLSLRRSRSFCASFFEEMLKAGIAEKHPDLAERFLQESLYFVPDPFVHVLQRSKRKQRVAAVLRLLRERADQVPELERICRRLAKSDDAGLRGFAQEILIRRGVVPAGAVPKAGAQIVEQSGITFVRIRAGDFLMGSDKGQQWEKPPHRVRISHDLLLGKYPVTNAQYARFLETAGRSLTKPRYWDDGRFNQPEQPVVGVTWDEAKAFCEWVGGRLPTEAEWEYACRAGSTTDYSFGDNPKDLGEYAWFHGNNGGQTQPVGAKKPNAWGLHDMHGNVWEWCWDWFDGDYYSISPSDNPQGPSQAAFRVYRGGSWASAAGHCRSAFRGRREPGYRRDDLGFRVAAVPSGSGPEQENGPAEPVA